MHHHVGPYRFSGTDVERTLAHADDLFRLLPGGDRPTAPWPAAPHRFAALAAVDEHAAAEPVRALTEWWGHWREGMDALRSAGAFGAAASGTVAHLFRGDGGVPKRPEQHVDVDWGGVVGDRQRERRHHGRPWQALCLWSAEVIDTLAAAGHPIGPGAAGENVTVRGLDWSRVVPGAQVRVGGVLAELSAYADPCRTIAHCFTDRRFDAVHHRRGSVSRVYAAVLQPGEISVGDEIVLEPGA